MLIQTTCEGTAEISSLPSSMLWRTGKDQTRKHQRSSKSQASRGGDCFFSICGSLQFAWRGESPLPPSGVWGTVYSVSIRFSKVQFFEEKWKRIRFSRFLSVFQLAAERRIRETNGWLFRFSPGFGLFFRRQVSWRQWVMSKNGHNIWFTMPRICLAVPPTLLAFHCRAGTFK